MSKETQIQPTCVYIVTCYQNVVGVYADQNDAALCQRDCINRNRPADILCRSIIYPQTIKS